MSTSTRASSEEGHTLWLAEDEPKIASLMLDYLKDSGFRTRHFSDGGKVVSSFRERPPDLLLLDIMLPVMDGIEICREIRRFSGVPIIFLTARVEEIDRLLGLELGADDYICKPFSPREVMARVKAVLRRTLRSEPNPEPSGLLRIDELRREVFLQNNLLDLTPNEFSLIKAFTSQPGRVFSRDQLMEYMYKDFRAVTDRSVDSHIKNLRKKLEAVLPERELILSVYGVGYKLEL